MLRNLKASIADNEDFCADIDAMSSRISTIVSRVQSILQLVSDRLAKDDDVINLDAIDAVSEMLNEFYDIA